MDCAGVGSSSAEMAGRIGSTRPMPMNAMTAAKATAHTARGWCRMDAPAPVSPDASLSVDALIWWPRPLPGGARWKNVRWFAVAPGSGGLDLGGFALFGLGSCGVVPSGFARRGGVVARVLLADVDRVPVPEVGRDQTESVVEAQSLLRCEGFEVGSHLLGHDLPVLGQPLPAGVGQRELRGAPVGRARLPEHEAGLFEPGEKLRRRRLRTQVSLREMADSNGLILFDDGERTQGRQGVLIADDSPKRSGQTRRDDDEPRYEFR